MVRITSNPSNHMVQIESKQTNGMNTSSYFNPFQSELGVRDCRVISAREAVLLTSPLLVAVVFATLLLFQ
jgi:hypothetical protein